MSRVYGVGPGKSCTFLNNPSDVSSPVVFPVFWTILQKKVYRRHFRGFNVVRSMTSPAFGGFLNNLCAHLYVALFSSRTIQ